MALTQSIETINSKLDTIPVSMGQVIYVRDTKKLFVDSQNGVRIRISDIEECTEAERVSLIAPLNKLYIIKDTKMLWYYSGGWTKLSGSGGGGGSEPTTIIDKVIRTQAQFEELYNSPTWLGAKSVAFVGNGGTLKFTRGDGQGCLIPYTVKQICGFNNAIIEVTTPVAENGGLYYQDGLSMSSDYSISNMTIINGDFTNCVQLTNCSVNGGNGALHSYAFKNCIHLTDCSIYNAFGSYHTYGFHKCIQLSNCNSVVIADDADVVAAFCSCTQLSNCTGSGSGRGVYTGAYAFYDCDIVNGCKAGAHCATAVTGGTMTHVDTASCDWTNPA